MKVVQRELKGGGSGMVKTYCFPYRLCNLSEGQVRHWEPDQGDSPRHNQLCGLSDATEPDLFCAHARLNRLGRQFERIGGIKKVVLSGFEFSVIFEESAEVRWSAIETAITSIFALEVVVIKADIL